MSTAPPKTFIASSKALRTLVVALSSAVTIASPSDGVSSDSVMASKIVAAVSALMFSRTAGDVARSCASELLTPDEMMSATLA